VSEDVTHRLVPITARGEWQAALEGIPYGFGHTWDNCYAFSLESQTCWLYCYRDDDVRVVCPIVERHLDPYVDVVTPYGFGGFVGTVPHPALHGAWRAFARDQGWVCAYIALHPVLSDRSYFGDAAVQHRTVFLLDLRDSEAELFARLSKNRKRQVLRYEADDWLAIGGAEVTDFFVETYTAFMASRLAARSYFVSKEVLSALCASPNTLLLGAVLDGEIVAASLFGYTPSCGDYLFNVSVRPGQEFSVPLIWAGARKLRSKGIPYLNLGGGVTDGDTLEEFKRRFGARRVGLYHVREIFRPDVYNRLCLEAGVDPDAANYFPAYRAGAAATVSPIS